jgi:hypothetical protein
MNIAMRRIAVVSLLAATAGCGAEPPNQPTAPAENHLLASIEMKGGNVFEFYEPKEGHILISEVGRIGSDPLSPQYHLSKLTAVDAFHALAPAAPVPATLLAAAKRADLLPKLSRPIGPRSSSGGGRQARPGVVADSLSGTAIWFQNKFCSWPTAHTVEWCRLDVWDGNSEWGVNYDSSWAVVAAEVGDVTFSWTGDYNGSFTVGEGYWRSTPGVLDSGTERFVVSNAKNNEFDFAGFFDD